MQPVRIKLYGLFPVTRRRYLMQQAFALICGLLLLLVWFFTKQFVALQPTQNPYYNNPGTQARPPAPETTPLPNLPGSEEPRDEKLETVLRLMNLIPWIVIPLLGAVGIETIIVLVIFARKNAPGSPNQEA